VRRLLNQAIALAKDVIPYYNSDGKENEANKDKWKNLHDRLARELGLSELSQRYYSYTPASTSGRSWPVSGFFSWDHVCEQFVVAMPTAATGNIDGFIKERISFIELVMRLREEEVTQLNSRLPQTLLEAQLQDIQPRRGARIPGSAVDGAKAWNANLNATFSRQVEELNERFRRAGAPLSYHNGFIQVAIDQVIENQVAKPFWNIVADPLWCNVDIDMKEALDRRDSNDKDPALFAAKALESAIKIVSDAKGWTRGTETGAAAYIDNLVSKNNGSFLAPWEGEMLKDYFRKVRNSLGHGPGSEPMPTLSPPQTDWAIETAMSWVRSLVRRM
jgi:hypothetical protein